jgi:L-lactate dehydrogenase complex protein LldG
VVADFRARLEDLHGALHEVAGLAEAETKVRELVGGGTVAAHPLPFPVDATRAPADRADVSVIAADVGIADTGQVAWAHSEERGRREALLPDRQVVVLRRDDLVASVAEALARWFGANDPPTNVVFAAGPSRTADIEQTMMLGVHAPRSLDVVLYG